MKKLISAVLAVLLISSIMCMTAVAEGENDTQAATDEQVTQTEPVQTTQARTEPPETEAPQTEPKTQATARKTTEAKTAEIRTTQRKTRTESRDDDIDSEEETTIEIIGNQTKVTRTTSAMTTTTAAKPKKVGDYSGTGTLIVQWAAFIIALLSAVGLVFVNVANVKNKKEAEARRRANARARARNAAGFSAEKSANGRNMNHRGERNPGNVGDRTANRQNGRPEDRRR